MAYLKKKTQKYLDEKADQVIDKIDKTPPRSFAILTLIIISVGVLGLSYFQFQSNLKSPLLAQELNEQKARIYQAYPVFDLRNKFNKLKSPIQTELNEDATKDSDGDGITDVVEYNLYSTSPYLSDTDSDGITDIDEINSGTDPNCPEGTVCESNNSQEGVLIDKVNIIPSSAELLNEKLNLEDYQQILNPDGQSAGALNGGMPSGGSSEIKQYYSDLSPDILRDLMRQKGFDSESLDKLSDEQLRRALEITMEKL